MNLTFRQGLARYQTDVYATPTFLQRSSLGGYIDLVVSPDPTVIVFAHRAGTYVVEEARTVQQAWGPFDHGSSRYLYWDVDLLTAGLTRGATGLPPVTNVAAPPSPAIDQHWFDLADPVMKVWNGSKWIEKLRVFAGTFSSQAIIQPAPLGTQAAQTGAFDGGSIVLDAYNKPLRQFDGTFVTSATELSIVNAAPKRVRFEAALISGMASEYIPKFSFVQAREHDRLALARSDDWRSRIVGLIDEDLYESEIGLVTTDGVVSNQQWSWPAASIGRPIFCGATGEVTLAPPRVGVSQVAGYVYDPTSVFLRIHSVTILDDLSSQTFDEPTGPPGLAPAADFTASPLTGLAPLSVTFADASLHAPLTYEWDVGNDGVVDGRASSLTVVLAAGTYDVRLRVLNAYGTDEALRHGLITVTAPPDTGTLTNLGIQLNGPLQIGAGAAFTVSVVAFNNGRRTGTNVVRTVTLDDVGSDPVQVSGPTGSTSTHTGRSTVLTLPVLPTMPPGAYASSSVTVTAPVHAGTIAIRGSVSSPEADEAASDNTAALTIRVTP